MKFYIVIFIFLSKFSCFSQNQHNGVIVDNIDKEPIEFVGISNGIDQTFTNKDGRFSFSTSLDSVTFYRHGYQTLKTTLKEIGDTIYLEKSLFELDEVVVTNAKTIYQKIKDSLPTNYLLSPHTEFFFIRAVLRKDDSIVRLQDIQGMVKRKTSIYTGDLNVGKNDFEIELTQLRKLGISKDADNVYFELPSLNEIFIEFVRLNAMGEDFKVLEKPFDDSNEIMVEFYSNQDENLGKTFGHYIINGNDNAILNFNVTVLPVYSEDFNQGKIHSRVMKNEVSVFFTEDVKNKLYFMKSAKRTTKVAVLDQDGLLLSTYEMEIILSTSKSFGNATVKSNVNEHQELFKIKQPYSAAYWQSQNQLLLTEEMNSFIERMGIKNKEFKVRGNF